MIPSKFIVVRQRTTAVGRDMADSALHTGPIIQQVKLSGLWLRPVVPAWCVGIWPNSVVQMTSVPFNTPDCFRSVRSAAVGRDGCEEF